MACAQEAPPSGDSGASAQVKPVFLRGQKLAQSTVGLSYQFSQTWLKPLDSQDSGDFNPEVTAQQWRTQFKSSGILAAQEKRNPRPLIEAQVWSAWERSDASGSLSLGGLLRYETVQSLDNHQWVAGLQAVRSLPPDWLPRDGSALLQFGLGQVQPGADVARQAAVGTELKAFRRWEAELYYSHSLVAWPGSLFSGRLSGYLRSLEFQWRRFEEIKAPAAVRQAGLAHHQLGSLRLNAVNGAFLAYSSGSLPFDQKRERAVSVGWAYKLF